ncbi:hypothetical protein TNCV_1468861 [Trichonephila clavipes]|nr:hypothetical protein TNCV_1468861 [Trichonephila clavipes]
MLGFPAMREPTKTPSRINSQKSIIISTFIDKYTTVTPKTPRALESHGKLATVGPIPRHLERADAVACFRLTTGHGFLGVYLH